MKSFLLKSLEISCSYLGPSENLRGSCNVEGMLCPPNQNKVNVCICPSTDYSDCCLLRKFWGDAPLLVVTSKIVPCNI